MEISIDIKHLDALAFSCANGGLKYYTLPTTKENLIKVFVKNQNGSDISNLSAWHLCRVMEAKIQADESTEEVRRLQQPKDTVVIVEPIDQLP